MKQIAINLMSGVANTIRHNPGMHCPANILTPPSRIRFAQTAFLCVLNNKCDEKTDSGCTDIRQERESYERQGVFPERVMPDVKDADGRRVGGAAFSNKRRTFLYKIPNGYFRGGGYFDCAPTVSCSSWNENNLFVWIEPKR